MNSPCYAKRVLIVQVQTESDQALHWHRLGKAFAVAHLVIVITEKLMKIFAVAQIVYFDWLKFYSCKCYFCVS